MKRSYTFAAALLAGSLACATQAATIDFDDLALAPDTYFRTDSSTTFTSGGATFYYDAPFGPCCWSGFTYSNRTDVTTPGYLNDGSAITGDGVGPGQDNYAVGYADGARLAFGSAQALAGAWFTNTTYAFLAMRDGNDGNTPPFVKGPFGPGDFFTLTITGLDGGGNPLSSLDVALAAGADVLDQWLYVDLSGLGTVNGLSFSFASSDTGPFGINTPAYFAMDNLTTVPLPGALWLMGSSLVAMGRFARRQGAGRTR
jgi:hypothetical protein